MGVAQWNTLSEATGCVPETDSERTAIQIFNGFGAIRTHLDQCARLKDYLCGRSKEEPEVPLTCYAECQVAQWLHSGNGKGCMQRKLLDNVCKCCHDFQEEAAQSVLLTRMNEPESILTVTQSTRKLDNTSKMFQTALADLHVECWENL